jgi:uncharacterized protein YcfL
MDTHYKWLGFLMAAVMLGGCASTRTPDEVFLDGGLTGWIEVEDLHVRRADSGLLEVQLSGRNRLDSVILMNYQFDWLDEEGRQVQTGMSRKMPVSAEGLRHFTISGVAPREEVTDFRLYIEERTR